MPRILTVNDFELDRSMSGEALRLMLMLETGILEGGIQVSRPNHSDAPLTISPKLAELMLFLFGVLASKGGATAIIVDKQGSLGVEQVRRILGDGTVTSESLGKVFTSKGVQNQYRVAVSDFLALLEDTGKTVRR